MLHNHFFEKPISDLIKKRISVRSYKPEPLTDEFKCKLVSYIATLNGPFNDKARFKLVDSGLLVENANIKLGTYGIIRGASSFIISTVADGNLNLEELGYEFEKLILYATSLGLGTCWLGGTFNKGGFAKAMELKEGEILPTVSPIGVPRENKSLVESLMRIAAGSKNRKSFDELFFNQSFNQKLSKDEASDYADALEMIRLAPSASNKQPWRVVMDNDKFYFYLSHSKGYAKSLGFDMQRIDIGIALCHFHMTLLEMGIEGSFEVCKPSISPLDENTEYIVTWTKL